MRWSKTFIPTLKEDPADAEVVSHKLLVRAGFIRQLSRGIYDYLPLSLKVIRKIETIVREKMNQTYKRIFSRCGLRFRPVEANTGAIGGSRSHEFQVLADSGEDAIVSCNKCEYAANIQKAETRARRPAARDLTESSPKLQKVATPGKKSVAEVAEYLKLSPEKFIKTLVYKTDQNELVAALVRGDHEINALKLQAVLGCRKVALASEVEVAA